MRLDHCCLNVRDMDAAIRFYERHFGMTLLSRREIPENDAEIAFVGFVDERAGRADDAMKLELTHWRKWGRDDYTDGSMFDHIAIVVDQDLGTFVSRLKAEGVRVAKEPFSLSTGSRIAFVHDLDGNWVELIERRG